jgi:predicted CopG family antitoxin
MLALHTRYAMPNIRISDKVYKKLSERGTLEDTFDTVIEKLLKQEEKVEVVTTN